MGNNGARWGKMGQDGARWGRQNEVEVEKWGKMGENGDLGGGKMGLTIDLRLLCYFMFPIGGTLARRASFVTRAPPVDCCR